MKVICDSCGSKYQIKDEKVRGKRVKIRCKGCKNAIVVDGTTIGEGDTQVRASVAPPPDTSAKQPEPEPKPALAPAPAQAPPPVHAAPPAPAAPTPSPAAAQASPAPAATPAAAPVTADIGESSPATTWTVNLSETDNRDMTTDQIIAGWKAGTVTDDAYVFKEGFNDWTPILDVPELAKLVGKGASATEAAPTPFAPPAGASPFGGGGSARAATAQRSGDMFGAAASAEVSEPPAPMFPSASAGKSAGTGARNESSVLFSLDALKAGFSAPPAPAKPAPSGVSEDPFDLGGPGSIGGLGGSLAANQALLAAPPPEPKKKPKPKPAVAKEGEVQAAAMSRGKMMLIGGGALAAMILVGVVGFALGGGAGGDETVAKNDVSEDEGSGNVRTGKSSGNKKGDKDEAGEAKDEKAEADDKDKDKDEASDEDKKAEATDDEKTNDKTSAKPSGGSKSGGTTTTAKKDDKKPERKTEKKAEPKAAAAGAFDKGAARSALASAAANAATCKIPGGPTGSGKAIVTFAPSGRVTTANVVGGKFGGTSVGGCVASRFRRARVPPFSGGPITVSKSFTVQ